MPGLLDFMNSDDFRMGAGLLAAGGPQTDPTKTGLGGAFQSAQASMDAWKKQQVATQLAQAQILDTVSQAQGRAATAAQAQRQANFLTGANYLKPDGTFDVQGAIAAGIKPEDIGKYADLRNAGKDKVARTIEAIGPNGEPGSYQTDDYGKAVGPFIPKWVAPQMVNLGGMHAAVGPTGTIQNTFANTASPDAQVVANTANEGRIATRENMIWENQFKEAAKADQQKNGPLNDVQSKSLLFGSQIQQANNVLDTLNDVKSVPGADGKYGNAVRNVLAGEDQLKLSQAKRSFAGALLRRESGAAIAQKEYDDVDQRYFPQVGDPPSVIEQKRQARLLAQEGIKAEVPNYDERISGINDRIAAIPPAKSSQPGGAAAPKAAIAQLPAPANAAAPASSPAQTLPKVFTLKDGTQVKAQKAPDGKWYAPGPGGKWIPVNPD